MRVAEGSHGARVDGAEVRVYTVPTDAPEGDGTLAWDSTTMVLVEAVSGTTSGIGWTYGAAATASVIDDQLAGVVVGGSGPGVACAHEAVSRALRHTGPPGPGAGAISAGGEPP